MITEQQQTEPAEEEPAMPSGINDSWLANRRYSALMITGTILPLLLYPFLSLILLNYPIDYSTRFFYSRILIWMVTGLMFLYARYAEVQDFSLWKEKKYNTGFYLVAIIVLYLLGIGGGMVARIPYWFGLREDNAALNKIYGILHGHPLLMLFTVITAGLTEEFIFRGYILTRLSLFFKNRHWPVVISAAMFAFMHLSYKTLSEVLFAFSIGIIYGYFYQKYRSLTTVMIAHTLTDLIALSLYHLKK